MEIVRYMNLGVKNMLSYSNLKRKEKALVYSYGMSVVN